MSLLFLVFVTALVITPFFSMNWLNIEIHSNPLVSFWLFFPNVYVSHQYSLNGCVVNWQFWELFPPNSPFLSTYPFLPVFALLSIQLGSIFSLSPFSFTFFFSRELPPVCRNRIQIRLGTDLGVTSDLSFVAESRNIPHFWNTNNLPSSFFLLDTGTNVSSSPNPPPPMFRCYRPFSKVIVKKGDASPLPPLTPQSSH